MKRSNDYICVPGPKDSSLSLSLKHFLAAPASEAISPEVLPVQQKVWRVESKKSSRSRQGEWLQQWDEQERFHCQGCPRGKHAPTEDMAVLTLSLPLILPGTSEFSLGLSGRLYFFPVSTSYSTQGRALPATKGSRDWNYLAQEYEHIHKHK